MKQSAFALGVTLTLLLSACGGDSKPAEPEPVLTVTVVNRLATGVNLSANGTQLGTVGGNFLQNTTSAVLTLPPGTRTLQWQSRKLTYSDGTEIPDELSGGSVSIRQSLNTIDITNVVDGVTYFAPRLGTSLSDTVAIGIWNGVQGRCLGWLKGPTGIFGVQYGYYRLTPTTEVRVYRGTQCGGASFVGWTYNQLLGFDIGKGTVSLSLNRLP